MNIYIYLRVSIGMTVNNKRCNKFTFDQRFKKIVSYFANVENTVKVPSNQQVMNYF